MLFSSHARVKDESPQPDTQQVQEGQCQPNAAVVVRQGIVQMLPMQSSVLSVI